MGEIYECESGFLINQDCLIAMNDLPDKSVDMILCDLPYGTISAKWDTVIPYSDLWNCYGRIAKDNAAIVLTASPPFSIALGASKLDWYRYDWVWDKVAVSNPQLAKRQPLKHQEYILVFSKKPHNYYPQGLVKIENPKSRGGAGIRNRASWTH